MQNAWKLLLLLVSKNHRNRFIHYILLVVAKVLLLGYLTYSAILAVHFGYNKILLLFIIFIIITFIELYRRFISFGDYIKCCKIILIESYHWVFHRLLQVEPLSLVQYNASSLSNIVEHSAKVPLTLFNLVDDSIEFLGKILLFSIIAVIEKFSNIIFIVAGFGAAYMILQSSKKIEVSAEYQEDISHSMLLLWDGAIHGENAIIEDRILTNMRASEKQRLDICIEQDKALLKAYIVLMIFMLIILYRTVNFDNLASVVLHVYSLLDISDMLDNYIILRDKLRSTVIDDKILEIISNMPIRPIATQVQLVEKDKYNSNKSWTLTISDIYIETPSLTQSNPIELHNALHVLIDGESGAGKSTLLGVFAALRTPQRLRLLLNGTDIVSRQTGDSCLTPQQAFQMLRSQICYMYQEVTMPIGTVVNAIDSTNNIRTELVNEVLELLEISHIADNDCATLTSTQQCLVLIAINLHRTLVVKHAIVIMDEVEKALDDRSATRIMSRLLHVLRDRCVLVVTHSEQVKRIFKERIVVHNGKF